MTPPEKVAAAMPGTLAELSERAGYPPGQVLKQIVRLRSMGQRVNAIPGERIVDERGRPASEPTIFVLDATSREE